MAKTELDLDLWRRFLDYVKYYGNESPPQRGKVSNKGGELNGKRRDPNIKDS